MEPVVISFTKISGGVAPNIIADKVFFRRTIRALDLLTYESVKDKLRTISESIASAFGASIEIEYLLDYPSLLNDKEIHGKLEETLERIFGAENVVEVDALMGGEDFAFYSRKLPSMFYFLGAKNPSSESFFLHHPKMTINEECIRYGSHLLCDAAIKLMKRIDE